MAGERQSLGIASVGVCVALYDFDGNSELGNLCEGLGAADVAKVPYFVGIFDLFQELVGNVAVGVGNDCDSEERERGGTFRFFAHRYWASYSPLPTRFITLKPAALASVDEGVRLIFGCGASKFGKRSMD